MENRRAVAAAIVVPARHRHQDAAPRRPHPEVATARAVGHIFRGSIPGPHVPLSTLHLRPHERRRMTRGRCGSLPLYRMTLSFTTSRRFNRRTEDLWITVSLI